MVLPGVQALFGFQLIAVFNQPFFRIMDARDQSLYLIALVLVAFAIAFLMGPAAYHRQAEPETVSRPFVRYASWLLMSAMVPLMVAVAIDVYLVAHVILRRQLSAAALAAVVFLVFSTVWFVVPQLAASRAAKGAARG